MWYTLSKKITVHIDEPAEHVSLVNHGYTNITGLMLKCCVTSTETVGLLGTGAKDVHLDFHTAPELCI